MSFQLRPLPSSKWIVCIYLLLVNIVVVHAQLVNFIPPSPTAAEFGKYGDIPVGNYTGVPSISIPLHTVKSGTLELPISISYHASGVQVQAEASWVGLGWSLNAGGVITRQTNGIDDLQVTTGYTKYDPIPPIEQLNDVTLTASYGIPGAWPPQPITYSFFRHSPEAYSQSELGAGGTRDNQPDLFFYNFLNYSGKMFFQKQPGNRLTATPLDQNNLRFIYDMGTQEWEVTDANGTTFFFHTQEISRSRSSAEPQMTPDVTAGTQSADMTTAWYLDKIKSATGDEITFEYNRTGRWIVSPSYVSQRETLSSDMVVNGSDGIAVTNNAAHLAYSASGSYTDEPYLHRINFANGHILFARDNYERLDREKWDLFGSTVSPWLRYFEVFDKNNSKVKMVLFDQTYFREDKINAIDKQLYLRLKLDAVREGYANSSGNYVWLPPYEFTYNTTVPLPAKTSFSRDHWGFYNGADNSSIKGYKFLDLPNPNSYYAVNEVSTYSRAFISSRVNYINDNNGVKIYLQGADREPHVTNMMAGILTSVTYPTKGVTKFTYEPNDYWNYTEQSYHESTVTHTVSATGITASEKLFTLTESTFVFIHFNLINSVFADPNLSMIMWNMDCVLEKTDGTDILKFIPATQPSGNNNVPSMSSHVAVALAPGAYRLRLYPGPNSGLSLSFNVKYLQKTATTKKMGGGIRIKAIENFDRQSGELIGKKTYVYTEGANSSGRFLGKMRYFYNESKMIERFMNPSYYDDCCYLNAIINPANPPVVNNVIVSSESNVPLGSSARGSQVGYGIVTVKQEDEAANTLGHSIYYYKNVADMQPPIFMPSLPQRVFIDNGQHISEHHYNASSNLVNEKFFEYTRRDSSNITVTGLLHYRTYNDYWYPHIGSNGIEYAAIPWQNMPVFVAPFSFYSEWWYLSKITEKQYDQSGGNPQTIITNFTFGSPRHKQVTKQTTTSSTGETIITTTAYATDLPTGTTTNAPTFTRMDTDNIVGKMIKEVVTVNGTPISGVVNNYTVDAHNHVMQTNSQKLMTFAGGYKTDIEFQQYDASGRVQQLRLADNASVAYLWAYTSTLPIVKGENVSHAVLKAAVEAAAGTTDLEAFWWAHAAADHTDAVWKSFNATLRANPALANAQVTTYTYVPLKGMTSSTDPNGRCSFYEYDSYNRLKYVRNHDGEILTRTDYTYRY